MTKNKKTCFVIMPFGEYFNTYYDDIYIPAIKDTDLTAKRADDFYKPGYIIKDIWDNINQCELLLADLTGKNQNVFYELGLAHAINKPVVIIAENIEDIPFDIRGLRVITYNKNKPNWGHELQKNISKSIKETIDNPEKSIPPTFIKTSKSHKEIEKSELEKRLLEVERHVNTIERKTFEEESMETQRRRYIETRERRERIKRIEIEKQKNLDLEKIERMFRDKK